MIRCAKCRSKVHVNGPCKTCAKARKFDIPYTPLDWNNSQAAMHKAASHEEAFQNASRLLGWYRRAIAIDYRVTADNDEEYSLRPFDAPVATGWHPIYEVKSIGD